MQHVNFKHCLFDSTGRSYRNKLINPTRKLYVSTDVRVVFNVWVLTAYVWDTTRWTIDA